MNKKLYKLMNWPEIEAIVYSEEDNPHNLLGAHTVTGGNLVQFFYPGVEKATVLVGKDSYPMEMADEEGYFAALVPKKGKLKYQIEAVFEDGEKKTIIDPYTFAPVITQSDTERFQKGIHYEIYKLLGAHPMEIDGVKGVLFAVWAPNAIRVSVVGDFNGWDGRVHQMRRLWDSGIFELFLPCAQNGDNYKFEIKIKGGLTFLKADPYANACQLRPESASVVTDLSGFTWEDSEWITKRESYDAKTEPFSVYELYLGSFARKAVTEKAETKEENSGEDTDDNLTAYMNYRELAPLVIAYIKEMGYTHVEIMPVMEHPLDASWGYQVTGYYAPTSRYGSAEDFKYFMNELHKNDIGVILDWVPAHFPRDSYGLCNFDGTCLYEHADPRKGSHPHWGTLIFNYGRKEVANFLIANALYWIKEYHADAIRMDAVASMLYLDYGKNDGEWVPNIYGGNENLEAIELIKHINSIVHKQCKGVMTIAEESTAWPKVTGSLEEEGLGFDLKWNMGWMNDFTDYIKQDPLFRFSHHGELTFSMIYAYSERFILALSHDEVVHGKASMIGKMPGDIKDKFKNLRVAYGYMMMHPGKKHLFMGQDIAEFDEWNENRSVQWELLEYDDHKKMQKYVSELNRFYKEHPALFAYDSEPEGFEWINCISANENVLVFLRKTENKKETLLVVCNFANEKRDSYTVGVPYPGKYKEIFNSDSKNFGGEAFVNTRAISSTEKEWDDREDSITFKMPALSVQVFSYTPFTAKEQAEIDRKKEDARKMKKANEQLNEVQEVLRQTEEYEAHVLKQVSDAEVRVKELERRVQEAMEDVEKMRLKAKKAQENVKLQQKAVTQAEKEIELLKKASEKKADDKTTKKGKRG